MIQPDSARVSPVWYHVSAGPLSETKSPVFESTERMRLMRFSGNPLRNYAAGMNQIIWMDLQIYQSFKSMMSEKERNEQDSVVIHF
jgi:hypothetical protein